MKDYKIDLPTALAILSEDLGESVETLEGYVKEDNIGGYYYPPNPHNKYFPSYEPISSNPTWPGGCVWETEGLLLYLFTRVMKPDVVVEIGSYRGCSLAHISLALENNNRGIVYAVDPGQSIMMDLFPMSAWHRVTQVFEDAFAWTPPGNIDLLHEDGAHCPGFTEGVMKKYLPLMNTRNIVVSHDPFYPAWTNGIANEFCGVVSQESTIINICPGGCGQIYKISF